MGGSRDLAGSRRALGRSARRRRLTSRQPFSATIRSSEARADSGAGFLFDETESTAPRLASAGRRCWPPRPCRQRSWTPSALPRRPSYRVESAGRPCPLIRRYGSPPCFLSGISGWRGGAPYPLRVAAKRRGESGAVLFYLIGAGAFVVLERERRLAKLGGQLRRDRLATAW
jgi:hypothetical protein